MPAARRSTARKSSRTTNAKSANSAKQSRAGVDAVRRAVERTVHTTVGSAGLTRDRAQEVVDEVVNRAERTAARAGRGVREAGQRPAGAAAGVSDRVREALHDLRQMTGDEMKELRGAIERLASQVESLESRVAAATRLRRPGAAKSAARRPAAKKSTARKSTARAKKSTARKSTAKKSDSPQVDRAEVRVPQAGCGEADAEEVDAEEVDRAEVDRAEVVRQEVRGLPQPVALMGRRVLITGVSGFWGTELARRLERAPEFEYIAGLDVRPPAADLGRTEFIRADIRNPLLSKLLPQTEVDTVVHCDVLLAPEPGKAPSQLHDINVIGSLQLLAACEKTESVRTIVVRGSAAIYGAEPNAPEFFTEDMARRFPLRTRFQRDIGELENYFENFARRFAQVTVMMLRYQPTLGTAIDSPLTRYLQRPVVPTQLGLRPAAPVRPRRGCRLRARGGRAEPGPRTGERRRRGKRLAQPAAAAGREGAGADPGAAVRHGARGGRRARPCRASPKRRCSGCATG